MGSNQILYNKIISEVLDDWFCHWSNSTRSFSLNTNKVKSDSTASPTHTHTHTHSLSLISVIQFYMILKVDIKAIRYSGTGHKNMPKPKFVNIKWKNTYTKKTLSVAWLDEKHLLHGQGENRHTPTQNEYSHIGK